MTAEAVVRAAREAAALFRLPDRGLLEVRGEDRVRWLDGMISGDVKGLLPRGPGAGCPALLLTPQGRIVADLHVLAWPQALWLELAQEAVVGVRERLARYIIADDVEIADRSAELARLGIEGPACAALLCAAAGEPSLALPAADGACPVEIVGVPVEVAAFGFAGGPALQLFVPAASEQKVLGRLREAGAGLGVALGDPATLDCLRIEAGIPWLGRDLDESVLPAEARLEHAVSTTKGCFTGQEVVARMRSRGRTSHLLVGLRFAGTPPEEGVALHLRPGERSVGEVTSVVQSPRLGAIGLGFVATACSEPGTQLQAGSTTATVAALPFCFSAPPVREPA